MAPAGLNATVEVETTGNCFANSVVPRPGAILMGDAGIDFVPEGARGRVQIPWADVDSVEVDVFRGHVRTFDVHTQTGLVETFVISDDIEALRCISAHVGRDAIVDVNEQARAKDSGPSLLDRAKLFLGINKR